MVEFALIAPLLCLILFAIIQFGIVYSSYVTLTDATRAGARKAAVSRLESQPEQVAEAAVRNSAKNLDQPCTATTGLCVSVSAEWVHGEDVTVEATYPYEVDLTGVGLQKRPAEDHYHGACGMKRIRSDRGQATVLTVIFLVVLIGMGALVLDLGSWFREQRDTQSDADAAALAAAQELPLSVSDSRRPRS